MLVALQKSIRTTWIFNSMPEEVLSEDVVAFVNMILITWISLCASEPSMILNLVLFSEDIGSCPSVTGLDSIPCNSKWA